tara:strand:+ start:74 stop:493 length:420 start_codon:yes stop_codon:yes gene_type:complete
MAKKKKRSKVKKFLKRVAPLALAGLGAAMLGRNRQNKEFLKTEGGDISILPKKKRFVNVQGKMAFPIDYNASPFEISRKVKDYGFDTNRKDLGVPEPKFNPGMILRNVGDYMPMKKGGRVGCGVAKRGFGKAMKKGGKR